MLEYHVSYPTSSDASKLNGAVKFYLDVHVSLIFLMIILYNLTVSTPCYMLHE